MLQSLELKHFLQNVVLLHYPVVCLLFNVSEVVIKDALLFSFHYCHQKFITHAHTRVSLVVLWHEVDLIIGHELVKVSEVIFAYLLRGLNLTIFVFLLFSQVCRCGLPAMQVLSYRWE